MDNFDLEVSKITMSFSEIIHGGYGMHVKTSILSDLLGDTYERI